MAISEKDRKEYEEGRRDRDRNIVDQAIIDITGNNPGSSAYYKGRSGEQLDADKKEEEDD